MFVSIGGIPVTVNLITRSIDAGCATDSRKINASKSVAMRSSCAAIPVAYLVMRHKALTGIAS
jgi:hypothetical protein